MHITSLCILLQWSLKLSSLALVVGQGLPSFPLYGHLYNFKSGAHLVSSCLVKVYRQLHNLLQYLQFHFSWAPPESSASFFICLAFCGFLLVHAWHKIIIFNICVSYRSWNQTDTHTYLSWYIQRIQQEVIVITSCRFWYIQWSKSKYFIYYFFVTMKAMPSGKVGNKGVKADMKKPILSTNSTIQKTKMFTCVHCARLYTRIQTLRRHENSCGKPHKYICNMCFKYSTSRLDHMILHKKRKHWLNTAPKPIAFIKANIYISNLSL